MSARRTSTKLLNANFNCLRLVATLLAIASSMYDSEATSSSSSDGLTCYRWESKAPRDCTCGRLRYDIEDQCQDDLTYYEQIFRHIETSSCPFVCENGGTYFKTNEGVQGCNCKEGYHGACCEIETYCGGTFFEPTGEFTTPGFPDYQYPNSFRCVWKITTDPERRIALSLKNDTFDVEAGSNMYTCNNDWLTVYDGPDKKSKRRGPYCGKGMRKFRTIYSSGRHLYIEFISNNKNRKMGFNLEYRTFVQNQECGPRKTYELPTAIITSPQYPLNYKSYQQCEYEIKVKPNHDLILRTLELNLPARSGCPSSGDRVIVYTKTGERKEEEVRFCGKDLYAPYPIRGAEKVILNFRSDYSKEGRFRIQYEQIPIDIS